MATIQFLQPFNTDYKIKSNAFDLSYNGVGPNGVVTDGVYKYEFDFSPADKQFTQSSTINNIVIYINDQPTVALYEFNKSAAWFNDAYSNSLNAISSRNGDEYVGTIGNDTFWTNSSGDIVRAGEGDDYIIAQMGDTVVYGNQGSDTISSGGATGGRNTIYAGQGDDDVFASWSSDVYGNLGSDTLYVGSYSDTFAVYGGQGDDLIVAGEGKSTIFGNLGNDTIDFSINGRDQTLDVVVISGSSGDDVVLGFEVGVDRIKSLANISNVREENGGVLISAGSASIFLHGVNLAEAGGIEGLILPA